MKIKNEYTASLTAPGKYNPNDFTATGSALFYIVMSVTFFAVPYLLKLVNFYELLQNFSGGDYFFIMCVSVLISQILILLFGLGYSLIKRVNPVSGGGYRYKFDFTPLLMGCLLIVGLQICFTPLHMQFTESATSFGVPSGDINAGELNGSVIWMIIYIIMVPTLPCICEEIVFRGILMRGFARFGMFASVITSAAMFSLFHGNFGQVILQFLGGVAIGGCVYITKNFLIGSAMHFFNNAYAVGFGMVQGLCSLSTATNNVLIACTSIIGLGILIFAVYYFIKMYMAKKGFIKTDAAFGTPDKPIPVLMSEKGRAENSSIVIDASQIEEFRKYYPEAMRYTGGGFVPLNKDCKSKIPAIILIAVGVALAAVLVVLNQFGF